MSRVNYKIKHSHVTRDIKKPGECPACDTYHRRQCKVLEGPCACALCELTKLTEEFGGYDLENLRCSCGQPSTHESGWCGGCDR